jgi:hypothetical protein
MNTKFTIRKPGDKEITPRSVLELKGVRDCEGDGSQLLATVELFGVDHHLMLIHVVQNKHRELVATTEDTQAILGDINGLFDFPFIPVRVPGFGNRKYVACMHPYGV